MPEPTSENRIEEMLKAQQVMLEKVMSQNKKIQRRLTIIVVAGYVKFLLILLPLIAAMFFLPPLVKQVTQQYSSLFNMSSGTTSTTFDAAVIQEAVSGMSSKDIQEILDLIGR
jgi:hypothetical protein